MPKPEYRDFGPIGPEVDPKRADNEFWAFFDIFDIFLALVGSL